MAVSLCSDGQLPVQSTDSLLVKLISDLVEHDRSCESEELWTEGRLVEAGWTPAVELLAIYRLELSEKEIHFAVMSVANAKLAPTSDTAIRVHPAGANRPGV